jgi:uncharacterized DUF497 family protein
MAATTATNRKEDRVDATTKRHYNDITMYEWDERKRDIAEVESGCVALVYTYREESVRIISMRHAKRKERRAFDASFKNR